jgi:hypothetical protein
MPEIPFGPPDAATADLDIHQLREQFVNIDGTIDKSAVDAIPRVVFGRKGAGKSHYIRALNAIKAGDHSVLAFGTSTNPPPHAWVIRLSLALKGDAIPVWSDLWQKACLAAAAATLLWDGHRGRLEPALSDTFVAPLEQVTRVALGLKHRSSGAMDPFTAARHIMGRSGDLRRFHAALNRPEWQDLEQLLDPILAASPPLYFFLDNLDSAEAFAPRPWQACQRGLLEAILHLAEDDRWKRLHVVVALKDTVVQSLFDSVNGQRYVHSPLLHRLEWNTTQTLEFLRKKIDVLPERWLTGDTSGTHAQRWLAREIIENTVRDCEENIEAYLLRHTLLLPRDVVEMGNCLCDAMSTARAQQRSQLLDDEVRGAVNRAAWQIGKTGMFGSGIEVARRLMPSDAPLHGASEAYGVSELDGSASDEPNMTRAITEQYADLLKKSVMEIRRDRFVAADLKAMQQSVEKYFQQPEAAEEATGALWRLGMVGVIDGALEYGEARFYGHSEHDRPTPPSDAMRFAFHPSMIDFLGDTNVAAIGNPVYPEPGFLNALGLCAGLRPAETS